MRPLVLVAVIPVGGLFSCAGGERPAAEIRARLAVLDELGTPAFVQVDLLEFVGEDPAALIREMGGRPCSDAADGGGAYAAPEEQLRALPLRLEQTGRRRRTASLASATGEDGVAVLDSRGPDTSGRTCPGSVLAVTVTSEPVRRSRPRPIYAAITVWEREGAGLIREGKVALLSEGKRDALVLVSGPDGGGVRAIAVVRVYPRAAGLGARGGREMGVAFGGITGRLHP